MFLLAKRIFLLLLVNACVILSVSAVFFLLKIHSPDMQKAPSLLPLFLFCAAWGIGGAFISLQLSRKIAIWTLRVKLLNTSDHFLSKIVEKHARASMLPCTPKIGIFPSLVLFLNTTNRRKKNNVAKRSNLNMIYFKCKFVDITTFKDS